MKTVLFVTEDADDEMYMTSTFRVMASPIKKDALELEHERQSGHIETIILYPDDVQKLYEAVGKFLNKTS